MIKSFTATTREIDDAEAAVAEVLSALDLENNLLGNSLGIISCFSDFEETGVLKAICDALPFDSIGATTCLCAVNQEVDQIIFTITVLTSDDCSFKTTAIPIAEAYGQAIDAAVKEQLLQPESTPALLLSFFPLINMISGDMILEAVDKVTGGIPMFGTAAVDHTIDYSSAMTIHNGEAFREAAVLGAIYGAPKLAFEIASLNENKIRKQKAIITESDGSILIGINGKTALEYLEEIGLSKEELASGLGIIPLVVDHKDGTKPVARAVFALTPDGHVVCGGTMPVNAILSIGRIGAEDVLHTTETTLKQLVEKESLILGYSCMARYLALGANHTAEAEKMSEVASDTQYLFACSGGEICPLPDADGKLKNYYHNYTIAFCRIS